MGERYATTFFQHALTDVKMMKRTILFFDKIYVVDLDSIHDDFVQMYAKSYQLSNLYYLIDNNIIENIDISPSTVSAEDGSFQVANEAATRISLDIHNHDWLYNMSLYSRAASIVLNSQGKESVPLLSANSLQIDINDRRDHQMSAIITVMNNFPLLSDDMSISDIVGFKNEPETKKKILRFRNWSRKWSTGIPQNEIIEEAEMLINEYQKYMDACDVTYKIGVVESTMSLPTEIFKGVITLDLALRRF